MQDPYAEPFLHSRSLSYELKIQVSSSTDPSFSFLIEGLDLFDMQYAFDMPYNPAQDCQSIQSAVEVRPSLSQSIPFVYSVDPVYTKLVTDNTDRMDRLFIDVPNYCGPKTHVFKD